MIQLTQVCSGERLEQIMRGLRLIFIYSIAVNTAYAHHKYDEVGWRERVCKRKVPKFLEDQRPSEYLPSLQYLSPPPRDTKQA